MIERSFHAMGGTVEVQLVEGPDSSIDRIAALFEAYEHTLSRFLPWGELAALHRAAGSPFVASPVLFDAFSQGVDWAGVTEGLFDPSVRDALEASGYDRTFEQIRGGVAVRERTPAIVAYTWRDIRLDRSTRAITLPRGMRIDLGGIGKGFTVDHAIATLGPGANAMVNASGDLYAAGTGPEGDGWRLGVSDPREPSRDVAVLCVRDRGVATSGSTGRWWMAGDRRYHHLIDTRSGRAAQSDLLTATIVAATATQADLLAKTAFLMGSAEGLAFVERAGAACLGVTRDGHAVMTGGMKEYLL